MGYILDQNFLPEKYFEAICQIPHGSYHEKPLSDYLVRFAEQHGLRCRQYENWNVIIYKPGSEGYEEHPPLMLQAHIDMVCEKEDGVTHDFEKDPLSIYVENGELRARGTTLGADDGVGVAYMLSLLEDDRIPHPPLECVFTVQEEVGLIGSRDLVFEDITAKRMIGLDDMGGDTCYVTSCGSQHVSASRDYIMAEPAGKAYRVEVSGLTGGHSGVCISREKGNAISATDFLLLSGMKMKTTSVSDPENYTTEYINRDTVACMNTPHAFRYGFIDDMYKEAVETGVINEVEPHTTTLMYKMGLPIYFSYGMQTNIKITRPEDLDLFEGYVLMRERRAAEARKQEKEQ